MAETVEKPPVVREGVATFRGWITRKAPAGSNDKQSWGPSVTIAGRGWTVTKYYEKDEEGDWSAAPPPDTEVLLDVLVTPVAMSSTPGKRAVLKGDLEVLTIRLPRAAHRTT